MQQPAAQLLILSLYKTKRSRYIGSALSHYIISFYTHHPQQSATPPGISSPSFLSSQQSFSALSSQHVSSLWQQSFAWVSSQHTASSLQQSFTVSDVSAVTDVSDTVCSAPTVFTASLHPVSRHSSNTADAVMILFLSLPSLLIFWYDYYTIKTGDCPIYHCYSDI